MLTELVILEIPLVMRRHICHTDLEIVHIGNHYYITFSSRLDRSCQLSLFSFLFVALFASTFGPKSFLKSDLLLSAVHFFFLAKTTLA